MPYNVRSIALALLASLLLSAPPTFGAAWQNSAISRDDQEAVALQKALAELAARRAEVGALKASVSARDEHIKALESILAEQTKLTELWQMAAENRAAANSTDAKIEASYQASVKAYEDELARVRKERDAARRERWYFGVLGLVIGAAIVLGRGN